mmetsp:Transcript_39872/g.100252  ORF Transcript_39872/g.100252 Transcript_39872/m.100252 type:complete len:232 (-) Transcript_39872:676-1371(-)
MLCLTPSNLLCQLAIFSGRAWAISSWLSMNPVSAFLSSKRRWHVAQQLDSLASPMMSPMIFWRAKHWASLFSLSSLSCDRSANKPSIVADLSSNLVRDGTSRSSSTCLRRSLALFLTCCTCWCAASCLAFVEFTLASAVLRSTPFCSASRCFRLTVSVRMPFKDCISGSWLSDMNFSRLRLLECMRPSAFCFASSISFFLIRSRVEDSDAASTCFRSSLRMLTARPISASR